MGARLITATLAGAAAWPILQEGRGGSGRVLAVYRRSLLWLPAPDQPLTLSFHPALRGPLTVEAPINEETGGFGFGIGPGTPVVRAGAFLHFGPLSVDLRECQIWDPPLPDLTPVQGEVLVRLITHFAGAGASSLGLGELAGESPVASVWALRALPWVRQLCRALVLGDALAGITAVRRLVGFGPGLTPSGDDFLGGALAALQAMESARPEARTASAQLADAIGKSLDRTTPVSRQFLRWALKRRYGEAVRQLLAHPGPDTLQNLLRVGASSGSDTAAGLRAGLLVALGHQPLFL